MDPFVLLLSIYMQEVVSQQGKEDYRDQDVQIKRYPCVIRSVVCFDYYTPDVNYRIA